MLQLAKAECKNVIAAREGAVEVRCEMMIRSKDAWGTEEARAGVLYTPP